MLLYYLFITILSNYFCILCIKYRFLVLPIWFIFELCTLLRWYLFPFKTSWSTLFIGNAFLFYKARSIRLHYLSYLYLLPNMLREMSLLIVASGIGLVFYIPEGHSLFTSVMVLRDIASVMAIHYYNSEAQLCPLLWLCIYTP